MSVSVMEIPSKSWFQLLRQAAENTDNGLAPAGQLLEQRAVPFAPRAFRRVHRHNAGADLARDDDSVLWKQLRRCQFLRARKRLILRL